MTDPRQPPARQVLCPICLDYYVWSAREQRYRYKDGNYTPLTTNTVPGSPKDDAEARTAYLRCLNPSKDLDTHYLPALYATFNPPIVVGLVGGSSSGKSHLLASMIGAIEGGGLLPYGITVTQLDFRQHAMFINESVTRLRSGDRLGSTLAQENAISYTDALLFATKHGTWPVTFFDVAGGDLARHSGNATRFLDGANALIFVVDPDQAMAQGQTKALTDPAFATVLSKLARGRHQVRVPTAVVLSKADRYRFRAPVSTWLARPPERRVNAEVIRLESRDVYGFLYQHDGAAWLRPFHECQRCTLHFASATGGDAVGPRYPRGVRPRRVLEPLVALLAMCQVISGPESEKVGIW